MNDKQFTDMMLHRLTFQGSTFYDDIINSVEDDYNACVDSTNTYITSNNSLPLMSADLSMNTVDYGIADPITTTTVSTNTASTISTNTTNTTYTPVTINGTYGNIYGYGNGTYVIDDVGLKYDKDEEEDDKYEVYEINVCEKRMKTISVLAKNKQEAKGIARKQYENDEISLDKEDVVDNFVD